MTTEFKIGCDPEIFVGDHTGFRSIIDTIGGTKDFPRPLQQLGNGFAVQEDNVALEFNVPPSSTKEEFIDNVVTARDFLNTLMQDAFGLHLVKDSAAYFPESELLDPRALEFGCDPDFNAWTGKRNPRPKADNATLRSCGGHVHIGAKLTREQSLEVIRGMDFRLGVASVLADKGELRKKLYGKHGAFRVKPYGVEYRVLSNFWIWDEKLIGWVYDNTQWVLDAVLTGRSFLEYANEIKEAIDNNNKDLATEFVTKHNIEVPIYA
jgi:hypothetical protein